MNKKEKKVYWLTYEWWIFLAPYQEGQKYKIVITNMMNKNGKKKLIW